MQELRIIGVLITDRIKEAGRTQDVLSNEFSSPDGIIVLELTGEMAEYVKLENELLAIEGLEVKKMVFGN